MKAGNLMSANSENYVTLTLVFLVFEEKWVQLGKFWTNKPYNTLYGFSMAVCRAEQVSDPKF